LIPTCSYSVTYGLNAWNNTQCSDKCRKAITSNNACAHTCSQWCTKDKVFWFSGMKLCVICVLSLLFGTKRNFRWSDKRVVGTFIMLLETFHMIHYMPPCFETLLCLIKAKFNLKRKNNSQINNTEWYFYKYI